jgi:hypothetical protein
MREPQRGIVLPLPAVGRYLSFSIERGEELRAALARLARLGL